MRRVVAHVTPTLKAEFVALADEAGMSVAAYFRKVIRDKMIELGWKPPQGQKRRGSVYLIKCLGYYKIGKALDVRHRVSGMSLPEKPELIAAVEHEEYSQLEKHLHKQFEHRRCYREWYSFSEQDVALVKAEMEKGRETPLAQAS